MLNVVEQLTAALREFDRQIAQHAPAAVPAERLALARTLPAFGPKTTPIILACVPSELWTRKQSRKKKVSRLQALFGIDPRKRESGRWKGKIKLSKRGIRPARTALYQLALCSIVHDPAMRAYYRRLTEQGKKTHKVALFDLARKHLRRLVAVLESDHAYEPKDLPIAA
jgi:transposase